MGEKRRIEDEWKWESRSSGSEMVVKVVVKSRGGETMASQGV